MSCMGILYIRTKRVTFGLLQPSGSTPDIFGRQIVKLLERCKTKGIPICDVINEFTKNIQVITRDMILEECYKRVGGKEFYMECSDTKRDTVYKEEYEKFNIAKNHPCSIMENAIFHGMKFNVLDEQAFIKDSLFCEWVFIIDTVEECFGIFKGRNKKKLRKGDYFYHMDCKIPKNCEYRAAKSMIVHNLERIPEQQVWYAAFRKRQDEWAKQEDDSGFPRTVNVWIDNSHTGELVFHTEKHYKEWIKKEINAFLEGNNKTLLMYDNINNIKCLEIKK